MKTRKKGLGTRLRRLLELLDGDLEAIYAVELPGYRPRFTPVMKALADSRALSVNDIAQASGVSQPAASQTVAVMVRAGWVSSARGASGRERKVSLTTKGRAALPLLERRWAATNRAAEKLESEIGGDLTGVIDRAIEALEQTSFQHRIRKTEGLLAKKDRN